MQSCDPGMENKSSSAMEAEDEAPEAMEGMLGTSKAGEHERRREDEEDADELEDDDLDEEDEECVPSELNPQRCGSFLHVEPDKLKVEYTGEGKHENDVGSIQANFPAPSRRMVYYFEVSVKNAGKRGCIAVGFSDRAFKTSKQPGWEPNSFGYHGDDGKACHAGLREPYGPKFTASDVIGAGINFMSQTIFFTKNREFLGPAFRDVKGELFPTVGLHSPQEKVEVNFGQRPFLFDIEGFVREEREKRRRAISQSALPPTVPNSIVRSYLLFYGYKDTLEALDAACRGAPVEGSQTDGAGMDRSPTGAALGCFSPNGVCSEAGGGAPVGGTGGGGTGLHGGGEGQGISMEGEGHGIANGSSSGGRGPKYWGVPRGMENNGTAVVAGENLETQGRSTRGMATGLSGTETGDLGFRASDVRGVRNLVEDPRQGITVPGAEAGGEAGVAATGASSTASGASGVALAASQGGVERDVDARASGEDGQANGASTCGDVDGGPCCVGPLGADGAALSPSALRESVLKSTLPQRSHIRKLIRQGDADGAMHKLFRWFPQVLQDDKWGVTFWLRATKFIQLVKAGSLDAAVRFARSELACFRGLSPKQDAALEECLALLAYENPATSPLGYLLRPQQRESVADTVNEAILVVSMSQAWSSSLGNGAAAPGVVGGSNTTASSTQGATHTVGSTPTASGTTSTVAAPPVHGGTQAWPLPDTADIPAHLHRNTVSSAAPLWSNLEMLLRHLATCHWEKRELSGGQGEVFQLRRILRGAKDGGW